MTKKQTKSKPAPVPVKQDSQSLLVTLQNILQRKWFPPVLFLVLASFYFTPYLGLNKIILGTDDGPRGWHTIGNHGHGYTSFIDKWSPLNGGTPMMERRFGRFINPTHVFHLIMPKYKARTLEYLFWTFVAGLFMFLFLQALGVSKEVSYICGIAYMFAPSFQSYIFGGHFARMEVIALMPGLMFFTERMLHEVNLLNLIGLPIIIALCVYSEHLQLAYFAFLGMGFYYAIRMLYMVIKEKLPLVEGTRRTAIFTAALVLGCLLTAMNIFPSMHHTNVTSKRAGGVDYEYASSFGLHPEEIFSLFEPDFIGWYENYWGQNSLKLNNEYFGIVFMLLAIMLFVLRKRGFKEYLLAFFFIFAVLFTLGAHTPVHKIFYYILPGMKAFRAPSFMYVWFVLSGFVMTAWTLDELLKYTWEEDPVRNKRLLIFGGIICGLALLYMIASGPFANFWYNTLYPEELRKPRKYNALTHNLSNIKLGGFLIFLFIVSFFTILYLKVKGIISKRFFIALFLVIICIDLIRVSRPFLTKAIKPKNYFTRQEKVEQSIERYLHQKDKSYYRVHAMLGDMKMYIPDLELTYIFDDFINKRYHDIVQIVQSSAYALQKPQYASNLSLHNRFINALSVLNTKYLLTLSPLKIAGLREVINSGGLRIYENSNVFPRFYLAHDILPETDTREAILKLIDGTVLNATTAVVDKEYWGDKTLQATKDTTVTNNISVKTYDTRVGHAILDVTSNCEQLLVIAENYNAGWTATVNENPTEIIPVNYYAKGVIVPQGKSRVELVFNSPKAAFWRKVTMISFFIFLLLSLCIGVMYFRKSKKQ